MDLDRKLEALLFWNGEPMTLSKVARALGCTEEELGTAITALEHRLQTGGTRLVRTSDELEIRTAPEAGAMLEALAKEELMRDLGKAGLETLAIILYKGPIKRSEIDYIRGVNSSFILRNLLIRGLIERISEKEGQGRGFSYKPTIDLLAHLGISKIEDLPEFTQVQADIAAFEASHHEA